MAEFTLSTRRAVPQQGGGALNPGAGTIKPSTQNAQASLVNPGSGQMTYAPVQVAKPLVDTTTPAFNKFMAVTANAAFRYQDRETSAQAQTLVNRVSEFGDRMYYGYRDLDGTWVKGYEQTKGTDGLRKYSQFEQGFDKFFEENLRGLGEAVKQKAIPNMHSVRSQYMRKASVHKNKLFEEYEEDRKYETFQRVVADAANDPSTLFEAPKGGASGQAVIYGLAETVEQGDKMFHSALENVVNKMFIDGSANPEVDEMQAVARVQAYVNNVVAPNMESDPLRLTKIQESVRSLQSSSLYAYRSRISFQQSQAKLALASEQKTKGDQLFLDFSKNPLNRKSNAELDAMALKGEISRSTTERAKQVMNGGQSFIASATDEQNARKRIMQQHRNEFRSPDGSLDTYSPTSDPFIYGDVNAVNRLIQFSKDWSDRTYRTNHNTAMELYRTRIKRWSKDPRTTAQKDAAIALMETQIQDWRLEGKLWDEILEKIDIQTENQNIMGIPSFQKLEELGTVDQTSAVSVTKAMSTALAICVSNRADKQLGCDAAIEFGDLLEDMKKENGARN